MADLYKIEDVGKKDGYHVTHVLVGANAALGGNYATFFNVCKPSEVLMITASWTTKGSVDAALNIQRLHEGVAIDAGDRICKSNISMIATEDIVYVKQGFDLQYTLLVTGDRLALEDIDTLTSLDNLVVTVYLKRLGKGDYQ